MKKEDIYYKALKTRDHRFDGKFFIGVKTTGIYCRPICPARPKRENVEFFHSALEAEGSGYRPCMRCRPECAPKSPAWIGKSAVVQRAIKALHSQDSVKFNEDKFSEQFGVSPRHLRRLFKEEIGKTPKQLSIEIKLNLAKTLISETKLPITEISYASGFSSLRRFNDAFKDRFKKTPRQLRRYKTSLDDGIKIALPYRPPFDFEGLLSSYKNHRVGNLEWFEENKMHRVITFNKNIGHITISNNTKSSCLDVEIYFPETSMILAIVRRVRDLFDLDSDPVMIANTLESNSEIKKLFKQFPGVRLSSGWDPFEVAISTILGQLVSVERGRALVHDLIEIAGTTSDYRVNSGCDNIRSPLKLFPTPQQIINSDLSMLKTTRTRKNTLILFSEAIIKGEISLDQTQDVNAFLDNALRIKGIGPWTAQYMALKILRDTDMFPSSDLILKRALEVHSKNVINNMSPWRGYVAALFWRAHSSENTYQPVFKLRTQQPKQKTQRKKT